MAHTVMVTLCVSSSFTLYTSSLVKNVGALVAASGGVNTSGNRELLSSPSALPCYSEQQILIT